MEIKTYFKDLAHVILEIGKLKVCKAGDLRKNLWCSSYLKVISWQNSLFWDMISLFSIKAFN